MHSVYYFFTAFGLSALGALPVGLINLSLANRTIERGRKAGVAASFGAMLVEFVYTFVAVYFIDFLLKNETVSQSIKIISGIVLLVFGIYYLSKKKSKATKVEVKKSGARNLFFGMGIAGINMLIIPYWIFIGAWLKSNGFVFDQLLDIILIAAGSACGAMAVFLGYVWLGTYVVGKLDRVAHYTNKVIGVLFLFLAGVQMVRLIL